MNFFSYKYYKYCNFFAISISIFICYELINIFFCYTHITYFKHLFNRTKKVVFCFILQFKNNNNNKFHLNKNQNIYF